MRSILALFILILVPQLVSARPKIQGYAQQGSTVTTSGMATTSTALKVYPLATITVYQAGAPNLATIFADNMGPTVKANPFTCDSTGFYYFYVDPGVYDIRISPVGGSPAPFTIAGIIASDSTYELDASQYPSFAAAVAAAGSTNAILDVSRSLPVTANLTVPSNVVLFLKGAGALDISAGANVKINSPFSAPQMKQVFTGMGTVTFGVGKVKEVFAEWWGADGTAVADSASAINAMIRAVPSSSGIVQRLIGTYKIGSQITATNVAGIYIQGSGKSTTIIQPTTALAGLSIIKFVNCRDGYIRDLWIQGNSSGAPRAGIELRVDSPRDVASMNMELSNLIIGSNTASSIIDGIDIDFNAMAGACGGSSCDQNNEQHKIRNVEVRDRTNAGVFINGSNSNWNQVEDCSFDNTGLYAIQTGTAGGNFNVVNSVLNAGDTDIFLQGAARHAITVTSGHAEDNAKLIRTNTTANIAVLFANFEKTGSVPDAANIDFQSIGGILGFSNCQIAFSNPGASVSVSDPTAWLYIHNGRYQFNGGYSIRGHLDATGMFNSGDTRTANTQPRYHFRTVTASTTTDETDSVVICNSASAITVTLHTTDTPAEGKPISVYNNGAGACTVTAGGNGVGGGNVVLAHGHAAQFAWNGNPTIGNFWWVLSKY